MYTFDVAFLLFAGVIAALLAELIFRKAVFQQLYGDSYLRKLSNARGNTVGLSLGLAVYTLYKTFVVSLAVGLASALLYSVCRYLISSKRIHHEDQNSTPRQ